MDVLKAIDDMVEGFYKKFGDIHKKGVTQHEKHLTWVTDKYAKLSGVPTSTEEDKPYFSQKYNNLTFYIGYRIGKKEQEYAYNQGYKAAMEYIRTATYDEEE